MEKFQRSALIFSCSNGHFLCGACRSHSSIEVNVKFHPREWETRPVLLARSGQVFWKANVIERHCNLHYYLD